MCSFCDKFVVACDECRKSFRKNDAIFCVTEHKKKYHFCLPSERRAVVIE